MTLPDEISDLLKTSGNRFHSKVAQWFVRDGWDVEVSPYYLDQTFGKAREIDLIATKVWSTRNRFGQPVSHFAVRLYIECKWISNYSIFWFADKDRQAAEALVTASGLFRKDNAVTENHHYLARGQRVAKLFASSQPKAAENDPIYRALNQALNGMVALRGHAVSIRSADMSNEWAKTLEFPVVICNSFEQFYFTDFYSDIEPELLADNFQLEVQYAYLDKHERQKDEYFLIDFVEYARLDNFIEVLTVDVKTGANMQGLSVAG